MMMCARSKWWSTCVHSDALMITRECLAVWVLISGSPWRGRCDAQDCATGTGASCLRIILGCWATLDPDLHHFPGHVYRILQHYLPPRVSGLDFQVATLGLAHVSHMHVDLGFQPMLQS